MGIDEDVDVVVNLKARLAPAAELLTLYAKDKDLKARNKEDVSIGSEMVAVSRKVSDLRVAYNACLNPSAPPAERKQLCDALETAHKEFKRHVEASGPKKVQYATSLI